MQSLGCYDRQKPRAQEFQEFHWGWMVHPFKGCSSNVLVSSNCRPSFPWFKVSNGTGGSLAQPTALFGCHSNISSSNRLMCPIFLSFTTQQAVQSAAARQKLAIKQASCRGFSDTPNRSAIPTCHKLSAPQQQPTWCCPCNSCVRRISQWDQVA